MVVFVCGGGGGVSSLKRKMVWLMGFVVVGVLLCFYYF